MLRRALHDSVALTRTALRINAGKTFATSVATVPEDDSLKGLIDSLSSENEISPTADRTKSRFADATSIRDLKNIVLRLKEPFSPVDYLNMLKISLSLDKDKKSASDFIKSCKKVISEDDVMGMPVDDNLLSMLTSLLELGLREEETFGSLERKLISHLEEADLSTNAILPFVIASNRCGYILSKELKAVLKESLTSQIRDIDSASTLIAVLTHWDINDREVSQAAADKTAKLLGADVSRCVVTLGEMVSIMSRLAERGIRDKRLLPLLSARITDYQTTLSVRQLVSLAASCAKLNYFDARVQRRLAKDLLVDVNNLQNWSDVSSLVNSFSRLRYGEMAAWKSLATWVNSHASEAPVESLSIVIAGMARNGVEECRPAALNLARRIRKESASSQTVWLSTIQSLAYFRALTPHLAESVLNKDFVSQLLQSSSSPGDRLFKAMKILQINACVRVDLGTNYTGPTVKLKDLDSFIKFDDETTKLARLNKYGKRELETCNQFLSDVLFKIASPSTHIAPSLVHEDGVLVDARIVLDEANDRLVAISKWGDSVPRPILFFGWGQTRQLTDALPSEENALLGWDQLSLRLLRARGVKPIVVLHSELSSLSSRTERVKLLRKRISDSR